MASLSLGVPRSRRTNASGATGSASDAPSSSSTGAASPAASLASDHFTRQTDSDALLSRLSSMRASYLAREDFSLHFVPMGTPLPLPRRPPIINIGTALRCGRLDERVQEFLKDGAGRKQVVSLGAGSDARFWRLMADAHLAPHLAHYVELDFPQLTRAKIERIARAEALRKVVAPGEGKGGMGAGAGMTIEQNGSSLRTSRLSILPCDLRTLASPSSSSPSSAPSPAAALLSVLEPSLPTLILAECVLAYLPASSAEELLCWFARQFKDVQVVAYDMCVGGDASPSAASPSGASLAASSAPSASSAAAEAPAPAPAPPTRFGQVMLSNLGARGLDLPGARALTTPHAYAACFERILRGDRRDGDGRGGDGGGGEGEREGREERVESEAQSLKQVWAALPAEERARLSRLEGLDEVEELEMLLAHYCVVSARRRGAPKQEAEAEAKGEAEGETEGATQEGQAGQAEQGGQ